MTRAGEYGKLVLSAIGCCAHETTKRVDSMFTERFSQIKKTNCTIIGNNLHGFEYKPQCK